MKEIHTLVASSTGHRMAEPVCIVVDVPVPHIPPFVGKQEDVLADNRKLFGEHAREVVDAMMKHMPGGLVDAIFAELCREKASVLHIKTRTVDGG